VTASQERRPFGDDNLTPVDELSAALDVLDDVTRRRRIHQIITTLGGRSTQIQQEYRAAIVGGGHFRPSDWTASLAEAKKKHKASRRTSGAVTTSDRYTIQDGQLHMIDQDGIPSLLAKFVPRIVSEIVRDDGTEQTHLVRLQVTLPSGRTGTADVTSDRLAKSREWAGRCVGAAAIIVPASRDEAHVLTAAQILSADQYDTITVYAHTGWRTDRGRHEYLTASGAIHADGLDDTIQVDLGSDRLNNYRLPDPSAIRTDDLRSAVRASLDLRHLAPLKVMAPILAAAYRAPLPVLPETSVFAVGHSGSLKTAVSAVILQHYGAGLNHKNLPAEWKSTANALELTTHALANVLCVIDDYAPQAVDDPRKLRVAADRILRGVANGSGRQRLGQDSTMRPAKAPRAQILATGEDTPGGHSLHARCTFCEFTAGVVDKKALTHAQELAAQGVYALAMAGYARWLAIQQDDDPAYGDNLRLRMADQRAVLAAGGHLRVSEAAAGLLAGWREWLRYAVAIGAVDTDEAKAILDEVALTMGELIATQDEHTTSFSPSQIYLTALDVALISGAVHLADQETGDVPIAMHPYRCGWRKVQGGPDETWRAPTTCIGWVGRDGSVFLEPGTAHQVAIDYAKRSGVSLATNRATLHKRLLEDGHLAVAGKGRAEVQKRIAGKGRRWVLDLKPDLLFDTVDSEDAA
jgi:hypothetical protein